MKLLPFPIFRKHGCLTKATRPFPYGFAAPVCFFLTLFPYSVCFAQQSGATTGPVIQVVSPQDGEAVVGKRPLIKASFRNPPKPKSVLLLLDGVDVTPLSKVTADGVSYHPIMALSSGSHTVSLTAKDQAGKVVSKTWTFTLTHTARFKEAYVKGNVHAKYERKLTGGEESYLEPDHKVEGNINVAGGIWYGNERLSFDTNLHYLDQNTPILEPLEKGFYAGDFIVIGEHLGKKLKVRAEIGDIQLDETPYTVDYLSRRGGSLRVNFYDTELSLFSVKSEEVLGFTGGLGVGLQEGDHIAGASLSQTLFKNRLKLKATYLTSEDKVEESTAASPQRTWYGTSTLESEREGDVASFLVASSLFDGKLKFDGEVAYSVFDWDISDPYPEERDKAVDAMVHGQWGWFSYEFQYLYVGPLFYTLGNPSLPEDKQEFNSKLGATFERHTLSLSFSRVNDNVEGDPLLPRLVDWEGAADYTCYHFSFLPISLSYKKSVQYSTMEPKRYAPTRIHIDYVSGNISLVKEKWNVTLLASYSLTDDRSANDLDTYTTHYSLAGSYALAGFLSITPAVTLTQSKDLSIDVRTDTYLASLDIRSSFLDQLITFDVGGSYTISKTTDHSTDTRTLNSNFRLSFNFEKFLWRLAKPTISLEGSYDRVTDYVSPENDIDEFTLFLNIELAVPFSL